MPIPMPTPLDLTRRVFVCALLALTSVSGWALSPDAARLRGQYEGLRDALARSPFQRPLVVQSAQAGDELKGEVYAVIEQPFRTTVQLLQDKARWCEVMMLHQNIKRCRADGAPPEETLDLAIGRKAQHTPAQGHKMQFRFDVPVSTADFVRVQMAAESGPLGTRNHRVTLQAAPLDAGRSFVHLSYAHWFGGVARLATQAYLVTAGRDMVGFTVTGRSSDGEPIYINGVRGMVERNAMRYFLAVEAYLGSLKAPPAQQQEKRLYDWFALTEQHPRQLRELPRDEYIAIKRRELALQ